MGRLTLTARLRQRLRRQLVETRDSRMYQEKKRGRGPFLRSGGDRIARYFERLLWSFHRLVLQ